MLKMNLLLTLFLCFLIGNSFAEPPQKNSQNSNSQNQMRGEMNNHMGGQMRKPPKEALEACKNKSDNDNCEFTGPGQTMSGTCFRPNQDLPLACKPSDAPKNRHNAKKPNL